MHGNYIASYTFCHSTKSMWLLVHHYIAIGKIVTGDKDPSSYSTGDQHKAQNTACLVILDYQT